MLIVGRGHIYSPKHYNEYVSEIEGGTTGVGLWVEDDIAAWNLAWLSFPALDLYLQPGSTHAVIMQMINPQLLGTLQAMASPGLAKQYPGLRAALLAHPKGLKDVLDKIDLRATPAYTFGGRAWVITLYQRLADLTQIVEAIYTDIPAFETLPKLERASMGNVVYYDFAAKRQKG